MSSHASSPRPMHAFIASAVFIELLPSNPKWLIATSLIM